MKIAITGGTGLVGSRIIELLQSEFEFLMLKNPEFNLIDPLSVAASLDQDFDLLLHLAAYTNVDQAEKEREICSAINIKGTQNLLKVVSGKNIPMIYVSTDFVFDGLHPPYFEYSEPGDYHNLGFYAQTKYEAEKIVKDKAMIVRLSYPYRQEFAAKRDFVRTIKELLTKEQTINMVVDNIITPTFIDDFANALRHLLTHFAPGVYHLVGSSSHSPYEAGQLIAQAFGLNQDLIKPIKAHDYFQNKAPRPTQGIIKSNRNNFHPMHSFPEGLQKLVQN